MLAHGRWFSPGTSSSSTTKTGRHDIAEILLKVGLKHQKSNQSINQSINQLNFQFFFQISSCNILTSNNLWQKEVEVKMLLLSINCAQLYNNIQTIRQDMKVQSRFVRGRQIFVLFYLGVQSTMRDDTQKYVQFTCNIITCTMKSHYGMSLAFITWRKIIFALFAINKSTFTISAKHTCTNKLNTCLCKRLTPYLEV